VGRAIVLADAICEVSDSAEEAGALLAILKGESRGLRSVHEGRIVRGKHGQYRSPWQLARSSVSPETWAAIGAATNEATRLAASEALRVYRSGLSVCHQDRACSMRHYAGGGLRDKAVERAKIAQGYAAKLMATGEAEQL
jgi:hypothetical protein